MGNFTQFDFANRNSIDVRLVLEAPIGTQIVDTNVAANGQYTYRPNLPNISSAKIRVLASSHDRWDEQTVDFAAAGKPYRVYIELLKAYSTIGSIHGQVSTVF